MSLERMKTDPRLEASGRGTPPINFSWPARSLNPCPLGRFRCLPRADGKTGPAASCYRFVLQALLLASARRSVCVSFVRSDGMAENSHPEPTLAQWLAASRQWLEQWQRQGVTRLPIPSSRWVDAPGWRDASQVAIAAEPRLPVVAAPVPTPVSVQVPAPARPAPADPLATPAAPAPVRLRTAGLAGPWPGPDQGDDQRRDALQELAGQVAACQRCPALACTRIQTVFGAGPVRPRVAFFGEAPGADEDRQGQPFVGASGQLLSKIIVASRLVREEVYILNALKCRPPSNRTPTEGEIENCRPYWEQQLQWLRPEYIVCLGAVAVRAVLQSKESIGRLRGRFHAYHQAKVLVTYHPSYLLREPEAKRMAWDDMQMLMADMGLK